MRHNLIVAYSRGAYGLTTHEMDTALQDAQAKKNLDQHWPIDYYSLQSIEGSIHSYMIEDGIEIDMRAMKISDMKSDAHGNFIRLYLPKDRL